jgi:hypothetical protein
LVDDPVLPTKLSRSTSPNPKLGRDRLVEVANGHFAGPRSEGGRYVAQDGLTRVSVGRHDLGALGGFEAVLDALSQLVEVAGAVVACACVVADHAVDLDSSM